MMMIIQLSDDKRDFHKQIEVSPLDTPMPAPAVGDEIKIGPLSSFFVESRLLDYGMNVVHCYGRFDQP